MCDPDWLSGWVDIVRCINSVDGVTCSSPNLTKAIKRLTDKPVLYLPDRHDLEWLKEKKIHKGRAKKLVWWGYAHNAHILRPIFKYLNTENLTLTVIADSKESLSEVLTKSEIEKIKFVEYNTETVNKEIIKNDIVVFPNSMKHKDLYKSNNKTTQARGLNMPVAVYSEDLIRLLDEGERVKETDKWYESTRKEYDVRRSVKELQEFIGKL